MRLKVEHERQKSQKEKAELQDQIISLEDEKTQLGWNNQKENTLLSEKIKYIEYQRDQAKKELEDCERKLGMVTAQLRKTSDKTSDDQEYRRQQNQKKYLHQI